MAGSTAGWVAGGKAAERQVAATFLVADVFDLQSLNRTFDTVIDSGLLHVFTPEQRRRFVASLAEAVAPGGSYLVLGYADDEPGGGPPSFSPEGLRAAFAEGWEINYIRATQFAINPVPEHKNRAWLASIRRS
jgi:SAM-dependent methyltransferase